MAKCYAYIKYSCFKDCKQKFVKLLEYKVPESLIKSNSNAVAYKYGYTGNVENLYMDASMYSAGGSKSQFKKLLAEVKPGDTVFLLSLRDAFDTVNAFVDCMFDFKARHIHLYAVDEEFYIEMLAMNSKGSLMNLADFLASRKETYKVTKGKDFPDDFASIYEALKTGSTSFAKVSEKYNISVPTLRKLIQMYEG